MGHFTNPGVAQDSKNTPETLQVHPLENTPLDRFRQKNQEKTTNSRRSYTLSNGEWTITVGNTNSWSGVNGSGNLTYRGCDSQKRCLNLTGGRVTCRGGICRISWRNRNYSYILEEPMDNPDQPKPPGSATVLIVLQNSKVILKETGFKSVSKI
ncbi:MAG: hypothetical protein HC780_08400 [Leptolyngbyaceae cyanobacterium CSU_1_3]|nr:hypothetical protein [Leptolyngbyaceae cyanobacterium CSU_1_3]